MEREIFWGNMLVEKIFLKNEKEILGIRLNLVFLRAESCDFFEGSFPSISHPSPSSQLSQKLGSLRMDFLGGVWRSCRMRGGGEIV